MEAGDLIGVAVAGRGKHDGSGEKVLGLPAAASVIQFIETADIERGAREQIMARANWPTISPWRKR